MQSHLRLHFKHEEASNEQVLSVYPTTIRRRILRHLYLKHVRSAYLFKGCRQKFLDALLGVARIENYMPQVRLSCLICSPHPQSSTPVLLLTLTILDCPRLAVHGLAMQAVHSWVHM